MDHWKERGKEESVLTKRPTKIAIAFLLSINLALAFFGCGGGGGGGESTQSNIPNINIKGSWAGTYESNNKIMYYDGVNYFQDRGVSLKIQSNGTTINGNFITDTNIQGVLNGSLQDNTISFIMDSTSANCSGRYIGNGTIIDNNVIKFTYSGSDCQGSYSNKPGNLYKLDETSNIGWSGSWWAKTSSDYYTLVTLNTIDNVNYTGKIRIVNTVDKSQLTANTNGTWGWWYNPSTKSSGWMNLPFNNIQGKLYISQTDVIGGGASVIDLSTNPSIMNISIGISINGGSSGFGGWFQLIP